MHSVNAPAVPFSFNPAPHTCARAGGATRRSSPALEVLPKVFQPPVPRPDNLFAYALDARRHAALWEDAIFTVLSASGAAAVALSML